MLGALGPRHAVTLFTASDFGRTFTHNGDGTDHGWGGHHFVLGPALAGGDVYGRFPKLGAKNEVGNRFDSSDDQLHDGVLLPALAVDQLAATLARWLGLTAAQTRDMLPALARFSLQGLAPVARRRSAAAVASTASRVRVAAAVSGVDAQVLRYPHGRHGCTSWTLALWLPQGCPPNGRPAARALSARDPRST